jgi:hypothetical protein
MVDNESRNVAGPGSKIDDPNAVARLDPAPNELQNEAITAEVTIDLPDSIKVLFELD